MRDAQIMFAVVLLPWLPHCYISESNVQQCCLACLGEHASHSHRILVGTNLG